MLQGLNRLLIVIHRWMGILIGLVMLMWCLSGFVMMYAGSYPSLDEDQRLATLAPLNDQPPLYPDLSAQSPVGRFQVEMAGGRPVVRVDGEGPIPGEADLAATARRFDSRATFMGKVDRDQWTVSGDFRGPPFAKFALNDGKGTWLYVSTQTGRVVQKIDTKQRLLAWLGPIPHWLYPKMLRENGKVWSQVVIWLSAAGVFLTLIGLYVGVVRVRRGRLSPYRGWHLWHHVGGLAAGVLVLTWVASGLLSMNPWGLLEVQDGGEARKLGAVSTSWGEAGAAIGAALGSPAAAGAVSLRSSLFDGAIYVVASRADGSIIRLDAEGREAPLGGHDHDRAGVLLGGRAELLKREDDYYFSHGAQQVRLPVVRVITPDRTRYYLDGRTGALLQKIDAGGRGYRWWFEGFHRLDFTRWMRWRPVWDLLMIILLSGATLVCVTGVWLGWRHLRLLASRR